MKSLLVIVATSVIANASSILLDTTGGATPPSLGFTAGTVGQGIMVNTGTTLTQFGIWVGNREGGNAEFQVWDSTLSDLLYSDIQTVSPGSFSLVLTDPFSLLLQAGQTYYFDVLGPGGGLDSTNAQILGYTLAPVSSSNGLSLVFPNARVSLAGAVLDSPEDRLPIALQLIGTQDTGGSGGDPAPEPSTLSLVSLSAVLFVVQRLRARSAR